MSLICYLDDSGTDRANSCVTMAGYVSTAESWQGFEVAVKPLLVEFGVNVIHAMHLSTHKGEFKGWDSPKCAEFLRRVNAILAPRVGFGVSFSVLKSIYEQKRNGRHNRQTPYGFCFQALFERMLKDEGFSEVAKVSNVSFVLEAGNKHNEGIKQAYERMKEKHKVALPYLGEMAIAAKSSSIAIQMADLFAYFTRRHAVARENNNGNPIESEWFLQILRKDIRDMSFTANNFFYD